MIVLPVLDLFDGHVVRGIAGRRDQYRPIVSQLTQSSQPFDVVRAIRDKFGLDCFYVADLNGIQHQRPHLKLLEQLAASGITLIVDAGLRNAADARLLKDAGITRSIVGLESCPGPNELAEIAAEFEDVTFSLDLLDGKPRFPLSESAWNEQPQDIVRQVIETDIRAILPLDLADVGTATGGSTDSLCRLIRNEFPQTGLVVGGGVRGPHDLQRLHSLNVNAVLVASALHDGRLSCEDVHAWE